MRYTMEELLPVVSKLTQEYTAKGSSSIPYDTARMLMEAVIYCVEEAETGRATHRLETQTQDPQHVYEYGRDLVIEKTSQTRMLYEKLIQDFEFYRCYNYRDTIFLKIPYFLKGYDPIFNPQDSIIELSYPSLWERKEETGIDLICHYLQDIIMENTFLLIFEATVLRQLFYRHNPQYCQQYMGNLCEVVLFAAIGCVLADKPLWQLTITREDCRKIDVFAKESNAAIIGDKVEQMIRNDIIKGLDTQAADYFARNGSEFGHKIKAAAGNGTLEELFSATIDDISYKDSLNTERTIPFDWLTSPTNNR